MTNETNPLKRARTEAGRTQKWLAANSRVPLRSIQKAELGEINPGNMTARNILAISKALNVDPYILVYGSTAEEIPITEIQNQETKGGAPGRKT